MPSYNDYGIVLNSFDLSEADKIFSIYTKENGLVRAVGKSVKKLGSKISGKVEQLSCSYFQFGKGKNLDTICDIEQVNSFAKLRTNSTNLFYGILLLDIVNNFAQEGESESQETYELLYSSLSNLQETKTPESLIIDFILIFLHLHGFKPQFESCVSCSKQIQWSANSGQWSMVSSQELDQFPYSSTLGGLLCKDCKNIEHKLIPHNVIEVLISPTSKHNIESTRRALKLLQEHLNIRAKKEIKTFELVFSL